MQKSKDRKSILFIDGVGPFGGACRSLYELISCLSRENVAPYFLVARGTSNKYYQIVAEDMVKCRGLTRFDNTEYSHYRGLRWLVLLREIIYLPGSILNILKAYRKWKNVIQIIHANEITDIFLALFAKSLFRVPLVVHVRSKQWSNKRALRTMVLNYLLKNYADAIVAIDENVRASLSPQLQALVVHNSLNINADVGFYKKQYLSGSDGSLRKLNVGFVGSLHTSKGIIELLEAAVILKRAGIDVGYTIAGSHTGKSAGIVSWLLLKTKLRQDVVGIKQLITENNLSAEIILLGQVDNLARLYQSIDLLVFPSHFGAPGRPVFEAAYFNVPSIVALSEICEDTLVDGETGIAIEPKNVLQLADGIKYFIEHPGEIRRMGGHARALAENNFMPIPNAKLVADLYDSIS